MPSKRTPGQRRVLVCRLDGLPSSGGLIDAAELGEFLIITVRRLRAIEADLGRKTRASYRIRHLKSSIPTISIEIATPPSYEAPATRILKSFRQGIAHIAGKARPPAGILPETIYSLRDLTTEHYHSIAWVEFKQSGAAPVKVPERFDQGLERDFQRVAAIEGKVSGYVEAVNVHDQSVMYLYPVMLPVRIACHFPPALLELVRHSVKRYTTVSGLQTYEAPSPFPARIDVEQIEVHPLETDLPSLTSLIGTASQPHGPRSTREYLALLERE